MDDADFIPFPGNLDPRAQEFFPRNPYTYPLPSVQFYYPYHPHPPLPPPPAQYGEVMAYPQQPALPAPCLPPQSSVPTRTLLVSMVPSDVSESLVRRELEVFGDVRAVEMERVRDGVVTVHFYDLRHAQAAAAEIQDQHMQQQYRLRRHFESVAAGVSLPLPLPSPAPGLISGQAVWAQFIIPVTCTIPGGNNQGTLVLLNLDPGVSAAHLKDIFRAFGAVKELRETPMKRHQRFVEFYDVRDAANALVHMNRKEINGKPVFIEFSRPGGNNSRRRYPRPIPFSSPKPRPRPITTQSPPPPPYRHHTSNHPGASSLHDSMESLTIRNGNGNGNGNGNDWYNGCFRSNSKKSLRKNHGKNSPSRSPSSSSSSSKQNRGKTATGKPWKKSIVGGNENDPRFMINEDDIEESDCRDNRTTIMIKNIPNKYSQKLLLNMLDNHCIHCNDQIAPAAPHDGADHHPHHPISSYDFVYLPIDFVNKCNVGYGFVNMTSPEAAWRLYKAFHLQTWEAFNSRKICEVTYARIQGIEALKEHFKNSRFPCEAEEYMPVVFSPPRDGRTLTVPLPIFGCGENPPEGGDDGGAGIDEGGGDGGDFGDGNDEN
ncbi:PREDICTED: protein terminal ear1 homolog [Ipomoea nil]|uniref:protein terminal ear1 homolog n=1 Tax=Ipomoea nil TaxID=35883 RepID=UPI000901C443|nr:PREDICTED: protein terminal ear1 homolog [Ipomoea nil]